ncbi:helix-turn-helix domain-containing protein [Nocardia cyriacigeorgica]|uniref:PucR family transcriptional regulator n=1 Tax=Nocardia cyriacigeorgica TaxID=135487 RepID=UPI001893C475|nr:helix-turn-helix domain-containing protein [Nocardia cyriacigeorgica]MBF6397433.1 helix-turn-helix domain-containing protein [Nocardia cyriacigeorgica]MBF6402909.1 helix-turn-helix domain-containing protein [Nocardia cyriacigeorgica]
MTAPPPTAPARAPRLAKELLAHVEPMADELVVRITVADHSYADSGLLTAEELREACLANLTEIINALAGRPARLQPARAVGRLKAERGVPIAALLHAFRLGGRMIWEELTARSATPGDPELRDLATELWELIDTYSDTAVEAYRETEILLAHADAQTQSRLIRTLFDDNSGNPARVLTALRTLGLPESGTYAVVSIEPADPGAALPGNLVGAMKDAGVRSVWDSQIDAHVGLLCPGSPAGIDKAVAKLADLVDGRIGLSTNFSSPQGIPGALAEARLAARSVRPGARSAVRFGDQPVAHLLVMLPEASRQAAAQILGPVLRLPEPERDDLIAALRAWYDCAGSTAAAAEQLHCHRNTVRYRLRKLRDLTGRDTTDPVQSAELHLALLAVSLLGPGATPAETSD